MSVGRPGGGPPWDGCPGAAAVDASHPLQAPDPRPPPGGPCAARDLPDSVDLKLAACLHQPRLPLNLGLITGERRGRSILHALYGPHVAELLDPALAPCRAPEVRTSRGSGTAVHRRQRGRRHHPAARSPPEAAPEAARTADGGRAAAEGRKPRHRR
jgi:hypothetical protein